jgi:hypothetical protein
MAIRLEIDNGDLRGRVDYTRYIVAPEQSPIILRDRMNQPALLDFSLVPADEAFVVPRRSAYVRLTGLADALPPGGPRIPGPLFTGFITNDPVVEFLGVRNAARLYGYRFQATSEDYLLNVKRIGVLPPFLNQTAGQILRFLTEQLQPGRFDLSNVAGGALVPFFVAEPGRSWTDIAREMAELSGFYYRVLDGKIFFQPIGDLPAGIRVDERDRHFRPSDLEITPPGNPVHNDVTVFGGVEPQGYVREYFVGDGFTSRFPLSAPVYGVESARLLADDFTGAAFDAARWQETDAGDYLTLFDGRLNVTGGTGTLGETALAARQALELGGELELIHGEFEFIAPSEGILGGLYASAALTQADCLVGFEASPIGGTTRLRALVLGAAEAPEIIIQEDRHYILVTRLSADQPFRTRQSFPSGTGSYGGEAVPAAVRVTLEVRTLDTTAPANTSTTVLYEAVLTSLPPFALYAPVNSANLHAVANFLQVTRPLQASLETQKPDETPRVRALGFGIAEHDATLTADPHGNQGALEFYEDTIPERGERISLRYRAAGRARARVRDSASIAAEAALAGDDGVRAAVLTEVVPAPRSSEEAELAALAYLADHTSPRYEGRYSTWGEFAELFPRSGRLLEVRAESRYPVFTTVVRSVTTEFRELATERLFHTLEFGRPSRFEDLLRQFAPPEGVLVGAEDLPLAAAEFSEIGTQYLQDAAGAELFSVSAAFFGLRMAEAPPAGGSFEVRRSDQGWSTSTQPGSPQNVLGSFAAQEFFLPRALRHQTFFVRPVAADGKTSRHSVAVAIHYPLLPPPPAVLTIDFGLDEQEKPVIAVEVALDAEDPGDVDAVELRDSDNSTVLARWDFAQLLLSDGAYRAKHLLDNSAAPVRSKTLFAYAQNWLGEFSAAKSETGANPEPLKPSLAAGNSIGQILEILLDSVDDLILETEIQVAGPGTTFSAPSQDVLLPGQPEKFTFVATQAGAWAFRARRRDPLGWSPWSDEPQGQIGGEVLIFEVTFFQARELDPSIGAAVNAQNLLPNSEFFLGGVAGQEGIYAARYYALANAASDGSELAHSAATNEMVWLAEVEFAAANPGFRSLLGNLGGLLNPGEPLTFSAALRHTGSGSFPRAVRFALRSAANPSYDQFVDVPAGQISSAYRWYSATFTLAAGEAVPADLAAEITVVIPDGQSLASELRCDKLILNRGHRPAAFSLAPWDVVPLAWNSGAGAYDLPATLVAQSPRAADAGGAGSLAGTGTEDLDPDFADRYQRLTL